MVIEWLVLAFATWRIASLLAREDGPFELLLKFRLWAGAKYNEFSEVVPSNQFSKMILCVWCSSVWIGLVELLGYLAFRELWVYANLPLAFSALSIYLDRRIGV